MNQQYRTGVRKIVIVQSAFFLAFVLILGIGSIMFYSKIESFFVFYPQRNLDSTPQALGLAYRDVSFEAQDGKRLHGWYFPPPPDGPVILFCHGNGGNISHCIENMAGFLRMGVGVFIFDYRGYGKSEGSPSEKGIYGDGIAAYDYLINREGIPWNGVVPFGWSLGGAVAIEVAMQRKVRALILESAFTSIRDMAGTMLLFKPISVLLPVHYDNLGKIGRVRVPVLIFHGTEDEIVPFSMGESLFKAASDPKFFFPIKGAGHNDTFLVGGPAYYRRVAKFVKEGR